MFRLHASTCRIPTAPDEICREISASVSSQSKASKGKTEESSKPSQAKVRVNSEVALPPITSTLFFSKKTGADELGGSIALEDALAASEYEVGASIALEIGKVAAPGNEVTSSIALGKALVRSADCQ